LRLIAGLDTEFHGQVILDGKRVTEPSLDRGLVFQEPRLFPWLTVTQNVALGLLNAGLSKVAHDRAVSEHIALVGLTGFQDAYPHQLSGGMAQRAAIARGLVNRPGVLLLDEPFGALDALTRARLQDELQRIWAAEGITMLLVTHDVEEAVYLGDRVVVMAPRPGRIAAVFDIPQPRPRDRANPALARVRDRVMAELVSTISEQAPTELPQTASRPAVAARAFLPEPGFRPI
jgi:sulfonate transport system ATP-binding protein